MSTRKTTLSLTSLVLAASLVMVGCSSGDEHEETTSGGSPGASTEVFPETTGESSADETEEPTAAPETPEDEAPEDSDTEEIVLLDAEGSGWNLRGEDPPDLESLEYPGTEQVYELENVSRKGMEPDDLVITAANIMSTWIANKDTSLTVAYRRALNLFDDDFDEIFTPPEKPVYPESWWNAMDHNAISIGWSHITDEFDEGDTKTYQVVSIPNWVGDDGWTLRGDEQHWTFIVEQDGADWIIRNFTEGGFQ